jgi:hypothetical protein
VAPRATANTHVFQWLRESGGSRDANVNGSITPVLFEYTVTEGHADITRMIVAITDSGTFDATLYGNRVVLVNGIKVQIIRDGAVLLDLLDGEPVLSNTDWAALCHDFTYHDIGTGDNRATIRWTFAHAGSPLSLQVGDTLRVTVQDDLTELTGHYFQIQGYQH